VRLFRLIFSVVALTLLFTSVSCVKEEPDGGDYIFRYVLESNPRTLDPQTATEKYAVKITANMFRGLLKTDSDGNIVSDAAAEYTVSGGGLVYTFTLRDDVYWYDKSGFEAKCTADDFVFAFKRLFNPATKSRNAAAYYCVKNAERINKGTVSVDEIGVKSDGGYKLTITLEYPEPKFPRLLTDPPAYPCNEEFYIKSAGRYGLTENTVCSNGAFYLSRWVYDEWWKDENGISLRRNPKNNQADRVYPLGVNYLMDKGDAFSLFNAGEIDCAVLSGEKTASIKAPFTEYENSVYGIVFNGVFAGVNERKALAAAIDPENIPDIAGYRKTNALIPDSIKMDGEFYRDKAGEVSALREPAAMPPMSLERPPVIIVPDDDALNTYIEFITQHWQEKLSFYCRIERLDAYEYEKRISGGGYDLAVKKFTAAYNSPSAILEHFGVTGLPDNIVSYKEAETALVRNAEVIPLCFKTERFFHSDNVSDLVYDSFTETVFFKEGKHWK